MNIYAIQMREFRLAQKGVILNKQKTHILVQKYLTSKFNSAKVTGKYALPGGKMEFGERPDEAFVREVQEETGIVITPLEPIDIWTWIYDRNGVITQIVHVSRLAQMSSGRIIDPARVLKEKESTISSPFWVLIKDLPVAKFVFDEQPTLQKFIQEVYPRLKK